MSSLLSFSLFLVGILVLALIGSTGIAMFDVYYLIPLTHNMNIWGAAMIIALVDVFIIVGAVLPIMYFLAR